MFKHKNEDYRVPRREKLFRLMTVLALLVALAVLLRETGKSPETAGTAAEAVPAAAETPDNRFCNDGNVMLDAIAAGGDIVLDCGGVLLLDETIAITTDTHIVGIGEYSLAISGTHELRTLFVVENGAALTLESLRIIDSTDIAIHIKPGGELFLRNCQFSGHQGRRGMAAAVWNQGGQVWISGCTFSDNTPAQGAVILNSRNSQLTMNRSIFRSNYITTDYMSNNAVFQNYGNALIKSSIFDSNDAAIANWSGSTTVIDTLIQNHNGYRGGSEYQGVALHNDSEGVMKVENSQIIHNQSYQDAAVVNKGILTLTNIQFVQNSAHDCLNMGEIKPQSNVTCEAYGG
jgi:hypothetical protein